MYNVFVLAPRLVKLKKLRVCLTGPLCASVCVSELVLDTKSSPAEARSSVPMECA